MSIRFFSSYIWARASAKVKEQARQEAEKARKKAEEKQYRILDNQVGRYFWNGEIIGNKKEVIEALADYHDTDYKGVKDDGKDTPYKNIWEFLATLKDDDEKLNWLLEYGEWELEAVNKKEVSMKYIACKCGEVIDEREKMSCGEVLENTGLWEWYCVKCGRALEITIEEGNKYADKLEDKGV